MKKGVLFMKHWAFDFSLLLFTFDLDFR